MTDRDELLRQIGEKVVERVNHQALLRVPLTPNTSTRICPTCPSMEENPEFHFDSSRQHHPDCELTRYLEATDEC